VASSISHPLPRLSLSNLIDQLLDEHVAEELKFSATMTNAPGPPMTLLR
jgi:hypothetical protein